MAVRRIRRGVVLGKDLVVDEFGQFCRFRKTWFHLPADKLGELHDVESVVGVHEAQDRAYQRYQEENPRIPDLGGKEEPRDHSDGGHVEGQDGSLRRCSEDDLLTQRLVFFEQNGPQVGSARGPCHLRGLYHGPSPRSQENSLPSSKRCSRRSVNRMRVWLARFQCSRSHGERGIAFLGAQ